MAAVSENIMVAGAKRSRDEASNAGTVDEDSVADTVDDASDADTVDEEEVDTSFPPPEDHPFWEMKNADNVMEAYQIICENKDQKDWIPPVVAMFIDGELKDGERSLRDVLIEHALEMMPKFVPTKYDNMGLFLLEMLVHNVLFHELDAQDGLEHTVLAAQHVYHDARKRREDEAASAYRKRCEEEVARAYHKLRAAEADSAYQKRREEETRKRAREPEECQRCHAHANPAFTSHALVKGEADTFYCGAACLQADEQRQADEALAKRAKRDFVDV